MPLISYAFMGIVFLGLPLFHLSPNYKWRMAILWAISLFLFSSYTNGGFEGLLTLPGLLSWLPYLVFILTGYIALLISHKVASAKPISIIFIIALFVYIKQYSFMAWSPPLLFSYVDIGLSFIIFRVLQVVIDHSEEGDLTFLEYLYHLFAFYTFLSGPIWSFDDHRNQLRTMSSRELTRAEAMAALNRVLTGVIKVLIVGVFFAWIAGTALERISERYGDWSTFKLSIRIALGGFAFFMSLYANFAGYMDIVNGFARLFLLTPPENFKQPLLSKDIIDFWARWHITLSQWFRDYLYYPALVALMRRDLNRQAGFIAGIGLYFFTFFLLGVWHGASNAFILMGLWLGVIITTNKLWPEGCAFLIGRQRAEKLRQLRVYIFFASAISIALIVMAVFLWWLSGGVNLPIFSAKVLRGVLQSGISLVPIVFFAQLAWRFGLYIQLRFFSRFGGLGDFSGFLPGAYVFLKIIICLGAMIYAGDGIPSFVYQDF